MALRSSCAALYHLLSAATTYRRRQRETRAERRPRECWTSPRASPDIVPVSYLRLYFFVPRVVRPCRSAVRGKTTSFQSTPVSGKPSTSLVLLSLSRARARRPRRPSGSALGRARSVSRNPYSTGRGTEARLSEHSCLFEASPVVSKGDDLTHQSPQISSRVILHRCLVSAGRSGPSAE